MQHPSEFLIALLFFFDAEFEAKRGNASLCFLIVFYLSNLRYYPVLTHTGAYAHANLISRATPAPLRG